VQEAAMEYLSWFWNLVSQPLFELGGNQISIGSILAAAGMFWGTVYLAKMAERLIHEALKDKPLDAGIKGSLERFTRYLVILIGASVALNNLGVNLNSLAALGGLLMVGVGFGLQNITQNFISGLIILLERPIKQGDLIRTGDITGKVMDIRARSTLIHTRDDVAIIVPNSQFISEKVINDSFSGERRRMHVLVGVAYGSDVDRVKELLLGTAKMHSKVLNSPIPEVLFKDFGSSSLDFELLVWVEDMWRVDFILSDLRFSIDKAFRGANITIPFPQRDLHLKTSEVTFS